MQSDVIGAGCAFPLHVQSAGRLALSSGTARLEQAMRILLSTYPGERAMRPEWGSRLRDFVFEPTTEDTRMAVAAEVRDALERWEPRADVDDVVVTAADDAGRLDIVIRYRVAEHDDPFELRLAMSTMAGESVEPAGAGVWG
jgi:hypothetical protein